MNAVWLHPSTDVGYFAICDFVSKRIWGKIKPLPEGTAMAILDGEKVVAGLVYNNYDPDAGVIEISGASDTPRWLAKNILHEMFDYPFNQMGCQAVIMRVSVNDTRLDRILTIIGFEKHILPRMRGRNEDEALYILADDVWRENKFQKGLK